MFTPTMFSRGRLLLRARLLVRDGAQHAVVVPGEVLHAAAVGEEVAEAEAVALVGLVHVAEEAERTYIHKYIYIYIYICFCQCCASHSESLSAPGGGGGLASLLLSCEINVWPGQ